MAKTSDSKPAGRVGGSADWFWEMRIWDGMCLPGLFRLLWRHRFAVAPRRICMTLIILGGLFILLVLVVGSPGERTTNNGGRTHE